MKAIKLITIIALALALTACGPAKSKKASPDDPWPEFSYVQTDVYKNGKIVKETYGCFAGKGTAPTQYFAEMQAESDAQAKMAAALEKEAVSIKGAVRVGETLIRFDKYTRMYTVYVRIGLPKKKLGPFNP